MKIGLEFWNKYIDGKIRDRESNKKIGARITICIGSFFTVMIFQSFCPAIVNGILAQFQVMISVYLVVTVIKKGYAVAVILNLAEAAMTANAVFLRGNTSAFPGIIVSLCTIITISIIFVYVQSLYRQNLEVITQKEALSAARDFAENANNIKSNFLSFMSHEIRTPMNSILGYLELMSYGRLDADQRKYLTVVSVNAKDLVAIIDDILDLSKIEKDKMVFSAIPFNPAEKVESILKLFELKASKKRLAIHFIHDPLPCCIGDPLRFGQIFTNLVGNAVKFTPEGGIIEVRISSLAENQKVILDVEVKDNGIGILPERQAEIFDAFVQGGKNISHDFGGTGLGLPISSHLVARMGGTLSVESVPEKGSRFFFTAVLPLADTELSEISADPVLEPVKRRNLHALVADDSPDSLRLMEIMLGKLGISSKLAVNGKDALEYFMNGSFDIVFLDGSMPVMNGYETAEKIREYEKHFDKVPTSIAALSAKVQLPEKELFIKTGADIFIEKPVSLKNLAEILNRLFPVSVSKLHEKKESALNEKDPVKRISQAVGISEKTTRKILEEFVRISLPAAVSEIQSALEPLDCQAIGKTAHRLKGAAGSLMMDQLSGLCSFLERCIHDNSAGDVYDAAQAVLSESADVSEMIGKVLGRG